MRITDVLDRAVDEPDELLGLPDSFIPDEQRKSLVELRDRMAAWPDAPESGPRGAKGDPFPQD